MKCLLDILVLSLGIGLLLIAIWLAMVPCYANVKSFSIGGAMLLGGCKNP